MNYVTSGFHLHPGPETSELRYSDDAGPAAGPSVKRHCFAQVRGFAALGLGSQDADAICVCLKPLRRDAHGTSGLSVRRAVTDCFWIDLRAANRLRLELPLDVITFIMPTDALIRCAREAGLVGFSGLHYDADRMIDDDVIANFAIALLPSLLDPRSACRLFVDYILRSVCIHLARTYCGTQSREARGGLAPWQERRAKQMMDSAGDLRVSLSRLAQECRLSVCHFVTAFRHSTGETPYQWHLRRRIDESMTLLHDDRQPLADIAIACGFSDQSHFTRAFSKKVGMSPGAWRKRHGLGHGSEPYKNMPGSDPAKQQSRRAPPSGLTFLEHGFDHSTQAQDI